jgi:hypothetical protein
MTLVRVISSLVVLLFISAAPLAARQGSPAPLDLAAMVLTPADLAGAGWDDLGLQAGQTLAVSDLAARAVWPTGSGPEQDAVRDDLLAAGWQQGYTATLATLWDPNRSNLGRQVEIELDAYTDAASATRGFAVVPDVFPTGPITPVTGERGIGDASRLVRVAARDAQAGTPSQELTLGFRHDDLTARILLRDWTGAQPDVATIGALADRLLARIEQVQREGGPGLSVYALTLVPRESAVQSAAYLRLDGEDVQSTYESPAEFAARGASYGAATDVFTSETEIMAADGGDPLAFSAELYRFPEGGLASTWLSEASARLGRGDDLIAVGVQDRIAGIGDEAVALTVSRDPGRDRIEIAHTSVVLVRVGAMVAQVRLSRTNDPPPLATTKELAMAQVACFSTADCLRPRPAPISLTGDLAGDATASVPEDESAG